jgi:hypothetical protein
VQFVEGTLVSSRDEVPAARRQCALGQRRSHVAQNDFLGPGFAPASVDVSISKNCPGADTLNSESSLEQYL